MYQTDHTFILELYVSDRSHIYTRAICIRQITHLYKNYMYQTDHTFIQELYVSDISLIQELYVSDRSHIYTSVDSVSTLNKQ